MSVLDDAKSVVKLVQDIGNIPLLKEIVNLQSEIVALVQERNDLKTEVQQLKEQIKLKGSLEFEDNAYWLKNEDGTNKGPFCSGCFDRDGKDSRLTNTGFHETFHCPVCNQNYRIHKRS